MRRFLWVPLLVVAAAAMGPPAHAAFPYLPGSDPGDYGQYRLDASDARPGELTSGAKQTWMYSADKEAGNEPVNSDPRELNGVRGAHMVDATTPNDDLAWATTTGRPDVDDLRARLRHQVERPRSDARPAAQDPPEQG